MDIGEKRKPQNGSLYLQIDGQEVYLRLQHFQQYIKKVSLFAFIYKHLFSPYHIFRYFQVRQQNYSRFTLFTGATRVYWTDWIWEDDDNVCIIRGN